MEDQQSRAGGLSDDCPALRRFIGSAMDASGRWNTSRSWAVGLVATLGHSAKTEAPTSTPQQDRCQLGDPARQSSGCLHAPATSRPASWPSPDGAGGWSTTTTCRRPTASVRHFGPAAGSVRARRSVVAGVDLSRPPRGTYGAAPVRTASLGHLSSPLDGVRSSPHTRPLAGVLRSTRSHPIRLPP